MTEGAKPTARQRPIEELEAATAFRDQLVPRADEHAHGTYPLWHGWAIVEAFLAGVDHSRRSNAQAKGNLHDELVEALRKAGDLLDDMSDRQIIGEVREARAEIDALLAKVKP